MSEQPAYVRRQMLPPQPPPGQGLGPLQWLRRNLFSGPLNILLTLIGIAIIWSLVAKFWPWLSHSVWNANSVAECRQIITERYGQGATGGCFAVIKHRWNQFLFGFYPRAEYWRPTFAFGLLFLALAPVLFSYSRRARWIVMFVATVATFSLCLILKAGNGALLFVAALMVLWIVLIEYRPRLSLLATAIYPFLGVWILWGGTLWLEIGAVLGLVLGYLVLWVGRRFGLFAVAAGAIVAVLWWLFANGAFANVMQGVLPISLTPIASSAFGGFVLAITIGVAAIAMSLPLGVILALARRSDMPIVKMFAVMFIEFIRGVPLISLLFVASLLLNYFLPPGTNFDIILRVIIMVTLFAAAYMAEVIRGGLAALPKGQYEAADSLGLDYWKAQRLIVLPQVLKISIPGIVSTFIGVFKDTTLVIFVGLFDPLKAVSDTVRASFEWKGAYWEPYIFTGTIFFVLCFGMSRYSMYLERRLKRENR